jgi:hypothetical protein
MRHRSPDTTVESQPPRSDPLPTFRHRPHGPRPSHSTESVGSPASREEVFMDPRRFDSLSRQLTFARSRRGVVASLLGSALGLLGLTETEAQNRRKRRRNRRKKAPIPVVPPISPPPPPPSPPSPPPPPSCPSGQRACQGQCIPTGQCCLDGDCGAGKGCFSGTCLTKQGICPTGADYCAGTSSASCGNLSNTCACLTTAQGQTRCGSGPLGACDGCTSDAQCAAQYPAITGAFCAKGGGTTCSTCASFCFGPCPV